MRANPNDIKMTGHAQAPTPKSFVRSVPKNPPNKPAFEPNKPISKTKPIANSAIPRISNPLSDPSSRERRARIYCCP